jgi:hypothetical protein
VAILAAIINFIITLQMLHLLPLYIGQQVSFWTFSLFGAFMYGLLGFVYFWLFQMFWTMQPQGWMFAMLLSGFTLILDVVSVLAGSSWEAMATGIIISGLIFMYCMLPGTKKVFGIPQ